VQVLDRGAQAAARGAACCASQILNRSAKTDACGAAQVLDRVAQADTRGGAQILNRGAQTVARGAAASAGEERLGKCSAQQGKYYRLYLYSGKCHSPRGDVPSTISSR
jgi:hypothetical protein